MDAFAIPIRLGYGSLVSRVLIGYPILAPSPLISQYACFRELSVSLILCLAQCLYFVMNEPSIRDGK